MLEIAIFFLAASLTLLFAALLIRLRFRLSPARLKFPFADFNISRFDSLTVVQAFRQITALTLPPSAFRISENTHPIAVMHAGWMMVCDAFVKRTGVYPTDENAYSAARAVGVQNVEFIILFRRIYEVAVREGDRLNREFAIAYTSRGPALAQRISGDQGSLLSFAEEEYRRWGLADHRGFKSRRG